MSGQTHTERKLKHELPEDIEFQSSANQVREFTEHIVWRDMREYLDDHILWCYGQMEDVQTVEGLNHLQGQIKLAKAVLGLPEYMIEQIEVE